VVLRQSLCCTQPQGHRSARCILPCGWNPAVAAAPLRKSHGSNASLAHEAHACARHRGHSTYTPAAAKTGQMPPTPPLTQPLPSFLPSPISCPSPFLTHCAHLGNGSRTLRLQLVVHRHAAQGADGGRVPPAGSAQQHGHPGTTSAGAAHVLRSVCG